MAQANTNPSNRRGKRRAAVSGRRAEPRGFNEGPETPGKHRFMKLQLLRLVIPRGLNSWSRPSYGRYVHPL
jgi:hypothetical protein